MRLPRNSIKSDMKLMAVLIGTCLVVALSGLGASVMAGANEPDGRIVCLSPPHFGNFTVKIFKYVSSAHDHGLRCNPITVAIPANITKEMKAALIASAINASDCGITADAGGGNVIHVTNNGEHKYGLVITGIEDTTGEYGQADTDEKGENKDYESTAKLTGSPTSGVARFGENEQSCSVDTSGKTITEIYQEWQSCFGEGTITADGWFELPARTGDVHGFNWEVTDPGLSIEIAQDFTGCCQ